MAKSSFKRVHDLEKRKAEAGRIQEKYTDRVPIDSIRGAPCRTPEEQYEEYLVKFNKAYSQEEKVLRMEYFKKSLQRINQWNQRPGTAIFGLTEFSDWSPEEWSAFTTVPNNLLPEEFYASAEADHAMQDFTSSPESKSSVIDWVREGVVSPPSVRKQEGPFCWCHAAVSCIEAQVQKQSNEDNGIVEKRKLSVQQLMDCVQHGTSTACFTHAVQEGILAADAYPYVGPPPRPCYCKSILKPRTFLTQVEKPLMHVDERAIKNKLKEGPLYAVVGCDPQLNAYEGVVLADCMCDASCANHAMTLVGASREHGRKYWLFKNSWGRDWGEGGFLKLVRGVKACRIGQFLHHPGKMRDTVNRISRSKRGNKGVRAEATIDSANIGCCGLFCSIC